MRRLSIAAGLILALAGSAAADIRIDDDERRPPRYDPSKRPPTPAPQAEEKGCASKSAMAPEWVFALTALGLGGWALRRTRKLA